MIAREFVDLSTRLCKDMKDWIAEAGKDGAISKEYMATLNSAIEIIEQVTLIDVQKRPEQ